MLNHNVLAWVFWIAGVYLLSQAIREWRESEYNSGYNKAYKDMQEISERAIVERRLKDNVSPTVET